MRFSLILITLRFFFSGYNLSSTCFKPSFISGIFYFILECIIITTIIITIVIILVFYLWSIEYAWMGSLFVGHPYKLFYLQFFLHAEFIFTLSCSLFSILSCLSVYSEVSIPFCCCSSYLFFSSLLPSLVLFSNDLPLHAIWLYILQACVCFLRKLALQRQLFHYISWMQNNVLIKIPICFFQGSFGSILSSHLFIFLLLLFTFIFVVSLVWSCVSLLLLLLFSYFKKRWVLGPSIYQ